MSLPNYLSSIKSSGIYRFVWDKSEVPSTTAETLRLVVGYSEKGPFNTPVYIDKTSDFITIFGNISKRLEKKGVFFHRMALQALSAGPILALNVKQFKDEHVVDAVGFDPNADTMPEAGSIKVTELYDTNRFWTLDVDQLPSKMTTSNKGKYINIAATDVSDNSCTVYIKKVTPESYNLTLNDWYSAEDIEKPSYIADNLSDMVSDYFAEVYVFRGDVNGYFDSIKNSENPADKEIVAAYYSSGEVDFVKYAQDSRSNFIASYTGCTLPYFKDANGYYISLDLKFNADSSKHKMIMKLDESILDDKTTTETIKFADNAVFATYLTGYTYSTPSSNEDIWKMVSNPDVAATTPGVLDNGGVREALTNRVDVEYHYIVDTFDTVVNGEDSIYAKNVFFEIAKEKDNAFAIVNFPKTSNMLKTMPSNKTFKEVMGAFKQHMPTEINGASWGAYYTQLIFSDGAIKTTVPSAALVSNLFMNKWGARQPYYIVAGPVHGRISYSGLVGPDFNYGRSDLDVLEPMGVNAIIYVPRKGTYINSNQTAKQVPVSALSKIHIRELVIYLQNEIENLLQNYQWELNTQSLRDTIKAKADAICETIMNNGGLYKFINICDETNNTNETIDNEMIILDTEIEPARGAGKMIHQLTIHKTGGLTSTVK